VLREISMMSFAKTLDNLPLHKSPLVGRFEQLIAPKSDSEFEAMAQTSRALTLHNFGRTMRLFAPLYLSNECINNCRYCGFSRDNPILRVTLSIDEVMAEDTVHEIRVILNPDVLKRLKEEDEELLVELERRYAGRLMFRGDPTFHHEKFIITDANTGAELKP
jgi:hypothetical protein